MMMAAPTRQGLVFSLCALLTAVALAADAPPARPGMAWTETFWYVPATFLPALSYDPQAGSGVPIRDQTVWHIRKSVDGYFWGDTVAVFSGDNAGAAGRAPVCNKMAGTVTGSGDVLISFINADSRSAAVTTGFGRMKGKDSQKVFEMQMSTGQTKLILHWAEMWPCTKGQACWAQLPGSTLGVEAFVAQCNTR